MKLQTILLGIALLFGSTGTAHAVVFKRCDNCTSPTGAARSVATETQVIVVDSPQNKLYAYDVMWDGESRRWVAFSIAVPAELPPLLTRAKAMAEGGGTATLYYDNRHVTGPWSIAYPGAYATTTAYDLLSNATLMSNFNSALAVQVIGSNSELARQFASFFYTIAGSLWGVNGQNLVIVFSDGSKITARVDGDMTKARIVSVEDKYGNPMAIPTLPNGGLTGGTYNFYNDNYVRDQWMYTAMIVGVYTTGQTGNAVVCVFYDSKLICNLKKE